MNPIDFDGILVAPKNGNYWCPHKCGDRRYPQPKWKTERGFRGHIEKCPMSKVAIEKRKQTDAALKRAREEAEKVALAGCTREIGDKIFCVREIIVKPEYVDRGGRRVRVRYEAVKRFVAEAGTIGSLSFSGSAHGGMIINGTIRESDICETMEEAASGARDRQTSYDAHCEHAAFCR